jgi:RNA polymerase sigma-70 factor, ECF subfamily
MEDTGTYEQKSDETLLKLYAERGEREAMGALFNRHADAAYATALRVCRNAADAEDAVQNAFIYVMKNAAMCRGGGEHGVKTWLMTIVIGVSKTKIRGEIRRRQREEAVEETREEIWAPEEPDETEEDLLKRFDQVRQVFDSLPEHYKAAIWLRYYHGLSRHDAAEMLEMPEKNLSYQLKNGMCKFRGMLAQRGVRVGVAAIVAAMPSLPVDSAPAGLLKAISAIASGTFKVAAGSAAGAAVGVGSLIVKVAGTAVVAGGIVAVVMMAHEKKEAPPPAAPVSLQKVAQEIHYSWNFNTPGVPPQFKAKLGDVTYVPGGGPDKDGCLQMSGILSEMVIDVPISNFPVRVSYRARAIHLKGGTEAVIRTLWFPCDDVVLFRNQWPPSLTDTMVDVSVGGGIWRSWVNYQTDTYAYLWCDGEGIDFTPGRIHADGRISIVCTGDHQLDDLEIRSIAVEDLPDAGEYLRAIERIPKEQRRGMVALPGLKMAVPGKQVIAEFYPQVRNWGRNTFEPDKKPQNKE